jgi:tetratricopeptide (TPR) repeat protein
MTNIELINGAALDILRQGKFYEAQTLFRQNVKYNPCFITYNNLGVFYAFEGLSKPDNSGRIATKLGMRYLKKAEAYQKSHLTSSAFGQICFKAKDYEGAVKHFEQACALKPDFYSTYNCGASYYMKGAYDTAAVWFKRALGICNSSNYTEALRSYIFSLLYSNKEEFLAVSHKMLEIDDEWMIREEFIFAYFANDLQSAESQIQPMLRQFCLDAQDMALVFDCLFKLGKETEAEDYLKQKVEYLEGFDYNTRPEISRMRKAFSQADYRAKLIAEYKHGIPCLGQCCYYGCKRHNNSL